MTDEALVAALAEVLRTETPLTGWQSDLRTYALSRAQARNVAAVLLPVVRRVAEQRAAEELLAAVDIPLKACCPEHASKRLRARAAALTTTPNHGRNAT